MSILSFLWNIEDILMNVGNYIVLVPTDYCCVHKKQLFLTFLKISLLYFFIEERKSYRFGFK